MSEVLYRMEVGESGENIMFASGREKPRRRFWQGRRAPNRWTAQEVADHVLGCYQSAESLSVVIAMTEDELPRKLVREMRAHDGIYREFHWWGFGWGGDMLAFALLEGPHVLCKTWGSYAAEAAAHRAAKEWLGDSSTEVLLAEVDRWPLLAVLDAVRVGTVSIFRE
jgi:hypothetical protein